MPNVTKYSRAHEQALNEFWNAECSEGSKLDQDENIWILLHFALNAYEVLSGPILRKPE